MSDLDPTEDSIPKSFVQAVKDRLSHPVAGIFIVVWILFNWRMIFFLVVATHPAETRIMEAMAYTDWALGFWGPLGATVAYLLGSPWLKVLCARWNGWVSEKQSLREYHDSLEELKRRKEIETRSLSSLQPAIVSQQEAKVRLEDELRRLTEQRVAAQYEVLMLKELSSTDWEGVLGTVLFEQGKASTEAQRNQKLDIFKQKIATVERLVEKTRQQFPNFDWDS